ncbi:MAG: acetyl-CoA decarbonylase/synthase complex subunit gamma [Anaerolineae bacterium]|nr:acetyl-CoA decarbonylase/synthase complex subunit gamma [Anaerolineae bacterium]MCB9129318.1 acetyl-CoA decarbonylase/synthase complex subunit gamma [Anaerolineales bacterium]MCB0239939.1 acetyl-CoA decarbonylase/synthase complex subunit gamma [Anaerolineae bacterium]MCB0243662.1 acetyl-CoA decarbonylase/synthase complex subunit gamma [Anaerolineae bacterium]MCB0248616.1 acetyl-CoA decarbonylase/synthase complex subunit gamma [Anaerolineae bacterium]
MALSGLEIYKLLPKTNCKDCGFPTCLAFAMKLAQKQVELAACPHVSEAAQAALSDAAAPPIRLITLSSNGNKLEVGNETVLYRHEKTFFHQPGIFVRVSDDLPLDEIKARTAEVDGYVVDYVGMPLSYDGLAIAYASGNPEQFGDAVKAVCDTTHKLLILIADDPAALKAGLAAADGRTPLLCAANAENWRRVALAAKNAKAPLVVRVDDSDPSTSSEQRLDGLAKLTEDIAKFGVDDLVLDPGVRGFNESLATITHIRRLALKENFRALGYPVITFPGEGATSQLDEVTLAGQQIAKYAGFVVLDHFTEASAYALLVLRANIYTDPQKPIQVEPGVYPINNPGPDSPLMVTTNFSITYFSVANEVESSGLPGWLLVADAEGMSVLTAWAAGKFDAERIAKAVKESGASGKISHKQVILPGHVAVLMGELEEELPGWEIKVGPREAVDLPAFLKM